MGRRSCCVVCVDFDIVFGKVAAPRNTIARPIANYNLHAHLAVALSLGAEIRARCGSIKVQRLAVRHEYMLTEDDAERLLMHLDARVARGARDAAPVGVSAKDGGLDER